jgi:hypothetical protein
MYAATGDTVLRPRPFPARFLVGSWSYRHPTVSIAVRMTSGIWNLALGMFLLSSGYLVGLVPLAGSALLLWAVYMVAREQSGSRRNGQG